jgi:hypothetical protein
MLKRARPQRPAKSIDQNFDAFLHTEQLFHLANACFEFLIPEFLLFALLCLVLQKAVA